jgi:hypothetical protein
MCVRLRRPQIPIPKRRLELGLWQEASIYGQATIDGAGSFFYRIKVQDLGEPGFGHDTYWILLANGYTSGDQTLEDGNVQIRKR